MNKELNVTDIQIYSALSDTVRVQWQDPDWRYRADFRLADGGLRRGYKIERMDRSDAPRHTWGQYRQLHASAKKWQLVGEVITKHLNESGLLDALRVRLKQQKQEQKENEAKAQELAQIAQKAPQMDAAIKEILTVPAAHLSQHQPELSVSAWRSGYDTYREIVRLILASHGIKIDGD